MMHEKSPVALGGLILIGVLIASSCQPGRTAPSFEDKVKLAEGLQVGAKKTDVIKLLGEPDKIIVKSRKESLAWNHPSDHYGTMVLNFEEGVFTMGGAFLKGRTSVRLGSAKKK